MNNEMINITVQDLYKGLSTMISSKQTSEASKILWVDMVQPNDEYNLEYGVTPGSVLFGLEWIDNGKLKRGTLKIEPPLISERMN